MYLSNLWEGSELNSNLENSLSVSYNELECGTWVNGLKMYKKTISTGSLPDNRTAKIAHKISNINRIIRLDGVAIISDNSVTIPIPYVARNNMDIQISADKTNITISTFSNRSDYYGYITLFYTKQ